VIRGVGSQHAESKWISRRAAMTSVGSAKSMAVEATKSDLIDSMSRWDIVRLSRGSYTWY